MKKLTISGLIGLVAVAVLFLPGCATTSEGGSEADEEAIETIWRILCYHLSCSLYIHKGNIPPCPEERCP